MVKIEEANFDIPNQKKSWIFLIVRYKYHTFLSLFIKASSFTKISE